MDLDEDGENSRIPSQSTGLLRSLLQQRIVSATRYSWWAPQEAQRRCALAPEAVFSLTLGPVAIELDSGLIIGMASDPAIRSVLVWVERNADGRRMKRQPLAGSLTLHPIAATDPVFADHFWRAVIGTRIETIAILSRRPTSVKMSALPNEVGLCFWLSSGEKMVATHGLHDDSSGFSVISDTLIQHSLLPELNAAPLSTASESS